MMRGLWRRRRSNSARTAWRGAALAALLIAPAGAAAQPFEIPATFAGDFWDRPRLTGDWFGLRDEMGKRGVTVDVDLLSILQGTATGGRDTGVSFGGLIDYKLNLDTGKLGLWPGGFLNVHAMSGYGDNENKDVGSIGTAVNTAGLLPGPNLSTALVNLTYTQFLTKWLGLYAGKIDALQGDPNDFAHDFRTQFMNLALFVNPAMALVPISAYGGGVVVVPWDGAVLQAGVLDPDGTPGNNDVSEAFRDGVMVTAQARVTVKPFSLLGHQTVGFIWSNKERLSIDQDPSNIANLLLRTRFPRLNDPGPILRRVLTRFFPQLLTPAQPAATKSDTWAVYYNFDQFLWSPQGDPNSGIGVFFRFGASDGNPNPVKYVYSVGVGGKGIVPHRPRDTFGVGWAHLQYSNDFIPFLRSALNLGLDTEDTVEMYYNAAVTRWLGVTADLQIVNPGLQKTLGSNGRLQNVDTAVVGGLRAFLRF